MKKIRQNWYMIAAILCLVIVLLNGKFGILSLIFKGLVPDYIAVALCGLCIVFELVGLYNSLHVKLHQQRKK